MRDTETEKDRKAREGAHSVHAFCFAVCGGLWRCAVSNRWWALIHLRCMWHKYQISLGGPAEGSSDATFMTKSDLLNASLTGSNESYLQKGTQSLFMQFVTDVQGMNKRNSKVHKTSDNRAICI